MLLNFLLNCNTDNRWIGLLPVWFDHLPHVCLTLFGSLWSSWSVCLRWVWDWVCWCSPCIWPACAAVERKRMRKSKGPTPAVSHGLLLSPVWSYGEYIHFVLHPPGNRDWFQTDADAIELNSYIEQGCIKLSKSDSIDVYNATNNFCFKLMLFFFNFVFIKESWKFSFAIKGINYILKY